MGKNTQKFLGAVFLLGLLPLAGCAGVGDVFGKGYRQPTVEVRQMLSAPAPASPSSAPEPQPSLYCKIGRGSALFGHEWYDFRDTLFALHQGLRDTVRVARLHESGEMAIQAFFDAGGQKMIFCPVVSAAPHTQVACTSLYALEDDLREGIRRTFDIPAVLRGGVITCAYTQDRLKPLSVPAAGGN